MAKLLDGAVLNLPDTFFREFEVTSNFLEGMRTAVLQAEAKFHNLALAGVQIAEQVLDAVLEFLLRNVFGSTLVNKDIPEACGLSLDKRGLQTNRLIVQWKQVVDLVHTHTTVLGEFILGGLASELLIEGVAGAAEAPNLIHDVVGEANAATLFCQGADDGLANPQRCIGAEADSSTVVEFLNRSQEANVPFLDEVVERQAVTPEPLCDADHETEIPFSEGYLGRSVTSLDALGKRHDLLGREKRGTSGSFEPRLYRVVNGTGFGGLCGAIESQRGICQRIQSSFVLRCLGGTKASLE